MPADVAGERSRAAVPTGAARVGPFDDAGLHEQVHHQRHLGDYALKGYLPAAATFTRSHVVADGAPSCDFRYLTRR
jgi:hypothetical protein